jgi:hypothetical protein
VQRILLIVGVVALLAVLAGGAAVSSLLSRTWAAAKVNVSEIALQAPMADDVLGAGQFEKEGRAVFLTRFRRGADTLFRVGVLDLDSGHEIDHKVIADTGVQYLGQADDIVWLSSSEGLHALGWTGGVVVDQKQLLKNNPKLGSVGFLSTVDEGTYVDAVTGGLFARRPAGDLLVDPTTFVAASADESSVKRQVLAGTVPLATLSTGQMLTAVSDSGGTYLGIDGKRVVMDEHERMYDPRYLIHSRTSRVIELDGPKSVLVLSNEWNKKDAITRLARVSLDGKVLWSKEVRARMPGTHKKPLQVISSEVRKNTHVVLFIEDRADDAHYVQSVFTPCYATSINLANGTVAWETAL